MSEYQIRLYQDSDYEKVREIFSDGIIENSTRAFHISLRHHSIWAFMLLTFSLVLWINGSLLMSLLALIADMGLLYWLSRYIYVSYVQACLADDMLDIRQYYLHRDGYCFWVAESMGEVAGMVAAVPHHHHGGETQVELKRLSVPRKHRGKGIAKALTRTVIDYARRRGCQAVLLETSYPQVVAWQMYEKMGFQKIATAPAPNLVGKLIGFTILFYQFDLHIER
ncbi:hypothetical protein GDO81_019080 [Engystomops pustulosus]|uniref:N-acetyltransferase domain-containing protein n=1 Tax=Engystomops pustulosus TaxID=76066 RepID=A0AAV6ZA11_ENGPU|nr:hypothetical protein GDO81_019080 [Engystomops pustulosus]